MSKLVPLKVINNKPTISALIIADSTGNKYASVRELITRFSLDIEEFGKIHFADLKSANQVSGRIKQVAQLSEEQATFLMTLLKNSKKVVEFKKNLVKSFFELKKRDNLSLSSQPTTTNFSKFDFVLVVFHLFYTEEEEVVASKWFPSVEELTARYNNSFYRRTPLTQEKIQELVIDELLKDGFLTYDETTMTFYSCYGYGQILGILRLDSYGVELQVIRQRPRSEVVQYVESAPAIEPAPTATKIPVEVKKVPVKKRTDIKEELVSVELVFDLLEMKEKHNLPVKSITEMIMNKKQTFVKEEGIEKSKDKLKNLYRKNGKKYDYEQKMIFLSHLIGREYSAITEELNINIEFAEFIDYTSK